MYSKTHDIKAPPYKGHPLNKANCQNNQNCKITCKWPSEIRPPDIKGHLELDTGVSFRLAGFNCTGDTLFL